MDKRGAKVNGPMNNVIDDYAQGIHPRDNIDRLHVSTNKEEDDWSKLGIASSH